MKLYLPVLLILAVGTAFLTFSCGRPSPEAETVNILEWTDYMIDRANEISGDVEAFRSFYKKNSEAKRVYEMLQGTRMIIKSREGKTVPGALMRTLENNTVILERPIYVSEGKKNEALVSTDGETWYTTRNDIDLEIDNFVSHYQFETDYRPENLFMEIEYDFAMTFNESRTEERVRGKRDVEILEAGMVFKDSADNARENFNLRRNIVYLPEGTRISIDFLIEGNIVTSRDVEGAMKVEILRDMYFFRDGILFGLSWDNRDWSLPILSFEFDPLLLVEAVTDDYIEVVFGMLVNYHGSR
ncbi:MAG: hypothetical protein ACLFRY_11080 [Spirochaetia bacterium]